MAATPSPTASSEQARQSILAHHAVLASTLETRVGALLDAVAAGQPHDAELATLTTFLTGELLPHAAAEEETIYRAGTLLPEAALLVQAMIAEHRVLAGLIEQLSVDTGAVPVAGTAAAVRAVFGTHLTKENDLLLPALLAAGTDLAGLLEDTHHLLEHHG